MCDLCHRNPCIPGCPNAAEKRGVCTCSECGENIMVGEKYVEGRDGYYHLDCLEDMPIRKLLHLLDVDVEGSDGEDASWYEYDLKCG